MLGNPLTKLGLIAGKITKLNGGFSSQSCLITGGYGGFPGETFAKQTLGIFALKLYSFGNELTIQTGFKDGV